MTLDQYTHIGAGNWVAMAIGLLLFWGILAAPFLAARQPRRRPAPARVVRRSQEELR